MIDKKLIDIILDEQDFPYENMTLDERNYYLDIIKNCKDICDTDNKVDGVSTCEIIRARLKKRLNKVNVDGIMHIGKENRCINADIYLNPDRIIVDSNITRLIEDENGKANATIYTVLDEFTIENGKLQRRSQYNYDMKSLYDEIENDEMKGRLK